MEIFDALKCWITWLAKTLFYYIVEAGEFIIDALAAVVNLILAILPTVALPDGGFNADALEVLNFVIPVPEFSLLATTILIAWIIYRLYQWALRWAKAEE